MRLDRAVEWAASAHKRVGMDLPIDVRAACKAVGLFIRYEDLHEDTHGFLLRTPKRWYAVVNSRHVWERRRWGLAHELCEYLLIREKERRGARFAPGDEIHCNGTHERFCDRFAAALLMPDQVVRDLATELKHSGSNDKAAVMASRLEVSVQAMRIRLRELGLSHKRMRIK